MLTLLSAYYELNVNGEHLPFDGRVFQIGAFFKTSCSPLIFPITCQSDIGLNILNFVKGVFGWTAFDHLVHVDHVFLEDTILLLSIFAGQMGEFADSGRKFKSNSSQNIVGVLVT